MTDVRYAGDQLLDAWLNLSSTLWNTRVVSSMTFNETHVLGLLLRYSVPEDPMTATDLIRRTRLLKSQMNKVLTALETRGFITRVRAESDKRMIFILLTEEGKVAYLHEHAHVNTIMDHLVCQIGTDRALNTAHDLTDIAQALDQIVSPNK